MKRSTTNPGYPGFLGHDWLVLFSPRRLGRYQFSLFQHFEDLLWNILKIWRAIPRYQHVFTRQSMKRGRIECSVLYSGDSKKNHQSGTSSSRTSVDIVAPHNLQQPQKVTSLIQIWTYTWPYRHIVIWWLGQHFFIVGSCYILMRQNLGTPNIGQLIPNIT